jgi:hypothetical protein
MATGNRYAYRVLTVYHDQSGYVLADWGLDGAEQHFDDAKGLGLALTERGQDGWRLCQYTVATDGWPQGVYVLEHVGPVPEPAKPPTLEEQYVAGLSVEELEALAREPEPK